MDKFLILVEGYAYPGKENTYYASPSSILVHSKGKRVLIDPGANSNKLLKSLERNGLNIKNVDIIYLTHYHPDHFLAIRLFPNKVIYDGSTAWDEDKETVVSGKVPGTNIKIIPTPGHSPEHTSLLIDTKDFGNVCIAQDVFWWEDGKQKSDNVNDLVNLKDPFASDLKELRKSRLKVLDIADWIIPGHGKMFKNPTR